MGDVWMGEAAVEAVLAGADVLLLPADPRVAIGSLGSGRRRAAARRADRRLGAPGARSQGAARPAPGAPRRPAALRRAAGRPQKDAERALEIARASMTVVRNEGVRNAVVQGQELLPLRAEGELRILNLVMSSDWFNSQIRRRRRRSRCRAAGPRRRGR